MSSSPCMKSVNHQKKGERAESIIFKGKTKMKQNVSVSSSQPLQFAIQRLNPEICTKIKVSSVKTGIPKGKSYHSQPTHRNEQYRSPLRYNFCRVQYDLMCRSNQLPCLEPPHYSPCSISPWERISIESLCSPRYLGYVLY